MLPIPTRKHAPLQLRWLCRVACSAVLCGLLSAAISWEVQANAAEVVSLDRTTAFHLKVRNTISEPIWHREIMRQGLLVAARSEMCLPTADAVLGENIALGDVRSLELACEIKQNNRIELRQGVPGKRSLVWFHEFEDKTEWPPHRSWIERMESLSRGGFVEALEKAGYAREAKIKPQDASAPLPPELVELIDERLSFESQFLALRQLHQAIATDGETRARLGGLVRAYSNLGLLTEYQWHPMSYAFKARALLYAQRWAVRDPKSPLAVQHRAYAFTLVGMHAEALKDLEAAEKLAAQAATPAETPAWTALLDAFCHYDAAKIAELSKTDTLKPLATLLGYLCQEHEGSQNLTIAAGMEALKELPGCPRILDTLCVFTGPGLGHATTQLGPLHMATTLLPELAKADGLPKHVQKVLRESQEPNADDADEDGFAAEAKHRAELLKALRAPAPAGSSDDPAVVMNCGLQWSVLAQLIEETTFLQVFRRAQFIAKGIGVPADGEIDPYQPIIANHRLAPFLTEFRGQSDSAAFSAALRDFDVNDVTFTQSSLWVRWPTQVGASKFYTPCRTHAASLPNEYALAGRSYPVSVMLSFGTPLAVSPHSPFCRSIALERYVQPGDIDAQWEAAAQKSPHLAKQLSEFWKKHGNQAKVEEYLRLATKLDPSAKNCRMLAAIYKERGDDEKWLETLELFLKTPSLDLSHAQVQCEIAGYYAERREWDKALPYADEAAQTGAQWAMAWARSANEVNQNWEEAEKLHVMSAARYGEHPAIWYLFCQRNGCGRLDVARQAAFPDGVEAFAAAAPLPANYVALVLYFEGQTARAIALLESEHKKTPSSWLAARVALLADELGNDQKRDEYLKLVIDQKEVPSENDSRPRREELVGLARHLLDDIAAGNHGDLKFDELHKLRDAAPERDRCTFNYLLGCYLDKRGKRDEAIEYWKLCMGSQDLVMSTRTAAGFALHNRGVKPSEWKQLLFTRPEAANAAKVPAP
jgi:tetratricopeptide (TPR) repeat protein